MTQAVFNTLTAAKSLQTAGIPQPQAEAMVQMTGTAIGTTASKADLELAESKMEANVAKIKAEMEAKKSDTMMWVIVVLGVAVTILGVLLPYVSVILKAN